MFLLFVFHAFGWKIYSTKIFLWAIILLALWQTINNIYLHLLFRWRKLTVYSLWARLDFWGICQGGGDKKGANTILQKSMGMERLCGHGQNSCCYIKLWLKTTYSASFRKWAWSVACTVEKSWNNGSLPYTSACYIHLCHLMETCVWSPQLTAAPACWSN